MKVAFLISDHHRERKLSDAFASGMQRHGLQCQVVERKELKHIGVFDIVACIGVKNRETFHKYRSRGYPVIYFDKGYSRHRITGSRVWEYWRVSVNAHQPVKFLETSRCPSDRFDRLNLRPRPWRDSGQSIVICGSSAKYHKFMDLDEPTNYWAERISQIESDRPITYRPKPSWKEAKPIWGTRFSRIPEGIKDAIAGAHVIVTHGSNACFEGVLYGVPTISLGEAPIRPIASTDLSDIETPYLATDEERQRWLNNLAYCQFTKDEFEEGLAWEILRQQL